MKKIKTFVLLLAVVFAAGCSGENQQAAKADKTPSQAPAPKYPPTPDGLAKLMRDIAVARRGSDAQRYGALVDGLRLPNAEGWFGRVFGDKGPLIARRYSNVAMMLRVLLGQAFDQALSSGRPETMQIDVRPLSAETAVGRAKAMLAAMRRPVTLYEVSVGSQRLRYFVYVDGGWRTTGKMWSAF